MKYRIYTAIVVVACLLFTLTATNARDFTDAEIDQIIAEAPGLEQYPQASAIILIDQVRLTVNPDHSAVKNELYVVKLLQDRARRRFADIKRRYDTESDSVVVIKAVTHLPDGTVQEVEKKAINDLTPADLRDAAMYSNIMHKVVSYPGIAPGATIELRLRTYKNAPDDEGPFYLNGKKLFQGEEPIQYREFSLDVPGDFPIRYTVQNGTVDYVEQPKGDRILHTWSVADAPQIIREPFMPAVAKIAPSLIYTNADTWAELGQWAGDKFFGHVVTTGAIKAKADELTADAKTSKEKIERIGLFVIKEVREVGEWSLPLGMAGYEPHDADEVLANRYGDWRDKTVLLVSLLRAAGIEANPMFVSHDNVVLAEEFPGLKQFNAFWVMVPEYDNGPIWINPMADHCKFGYCWYGFGYKALLVSETESQLTALPEIPTEENIAMRRAELQLLPTGDLEGTISCQLDGYFDLRTRSRLKNSTPKEVEQYFQMAANAIGEGTLNREHKLSDLKDLMEPVQVAQKYSSPEMGIVQGDMMIFRAPEIPFSFADMPIELGQSTRLYPIEFTSRLVLKTEGSIKLPEGYRAIYLPSEFTVENELGSWTTKFSFDEQRGMVTYHSTVKLTDKWIDPQEYTTFKQSHDKFSSPKNRLILLEKES